MLNEPRCLYNVQCTMHSKTKSFVDFHVKTIAFQSGYSTLIRILSIHFMKCQMKSIL